MHNGQRGHNGIMQSDLVVTMVGACVRDGGNVLGNSLDQLIGECVLAGTGHSGLPVKLICQAE